MSARNVECPLEDFEHLAIKAGFNSDGLRKEEKILVPEALVIEATDYFTRHPLHFIEEFPQRQINSLYFDTLDHEMLSQSIEGEARRIKVRLRWYDEDAQGKLELKLKSGSFSLKCRSRDLATPREALNLLSHEHIQFLLANQSDILGNSLVLKPSIMISYKRKYLRSLINDCRVTLDQELKASNPDFLRGEGAKIPVGSGLIAEIKQPISKFDTDPPYNLDNLPFRRVRLSKYERACKALGIC